MDIQSNPQPAMPRASLIQLFFSPGKFFQDLNNRPTWAIGMLMAVGLALATVAISMPMANSMARNLLSDRHIAYTARVAGVMRVANYAGFATTTIATALALIVAAGILKGFSLFFMAEVSFKKFLAVVSYSAIVTGLDHVLGSSMNYLTANWRDIDNILQFRTTFLSVGAVVNLSDHPSLLAMSNVCSLFGFWYWSLLAIGLSQIGLKRKQALFAVVCLALLGITLAGVGGLFVKVPA